ncbi:MAG: xanthine dehydrogenase accessory protein XdhC [Rubrivivax sp.]|nr:xanthine dehydrogenase accessory protein XdhC [Rubrivivax sp.]
MLGLKAAALRWLVEGRQAVVVEVTSHSGSVPRERGTRMMVSADAVLGTIGGGHLELQAIQQARAALLTQEIVERRIALGPTLGQCCGGALTLRHTPLPQADVAAWAEPAPRFELQLYGAGHVGRAIVRLLSGIACRVAWIDEREAEFPPDVLPPHIEKLCVEPVAAEVAQATPGSAYLVLTHSHDLDLAITQAILERGDFGYAGLIGSKTKYQRFRHRFEARGIPLATIDRLTCPIGLPGIVGKEPEVLAVAVVAQLLALHPPGG